MAKKGKSFKKYGKKEDENESIEKFLDRITGQTKKERDMELRNTYRRLGMLEEMDKAQQLDDEARRRRTQLGNKRTKKQLSRQEQIRRGIPNQRMMDNQARDQADEFENIPPSREKEDPFPKPGFKHKKYKHNQMDRSAKRGINIKEGGLVLKDGLVLKVTNRGPLYKGKKSGKKKT